MTVISNPGNAMFFNGISDAVIVPNGLFSKTGKTLPGGEKSFSHLQLLEQSEVNTNNTLTINNFTLEAWVIPDQGGVIFEYENLLKLSIGSPTAPGPVTLDISLNAVEGGHTFTETISSATPIINTYGQVKSWEGLIYPYTAVNSIDSYDAFNKTKPNVSALTLGHRELLQVTVTFNGKNLVIYVNGEIAVSHDFVEIHKLILNDGRIFLGGRGGEFRGIIESVHWARGASDIASEPYAPVKSNSTLGLWRFQEPILPIDTIIDIPTVSASNSASTVTVGTVAAANLILTILGVTSTSTTTLDLTATPHSNGSYKVARYTDGAVSSVDIPHVSYNLLINPLGYDRTTGKPNNLPPERVRITGINSSAGTIIIESIHLDYVANTSTGRRGLIHTRTVTSEAVLIMGDCLIDNGMGEPHQPTGTATQFAYRAGQVIIDESIYENHGIVTSLSMAVRETIGRLSDAINSNNQYNAVVASTVNTNLLIGHTGRHYLNHVKSHPYMGILPTPINESITQKVDGISDVFEVQFPDHYSTVQDQVPINSQISLYDTKPFQNIKSIISSSDAFIAIENGMAGVSTSSRGLLAIGGVGIKDNTGSTQFDPSPFILKSLNGHNLANISNDVNSKTYIKHLTPILEPRIAILEVPSLADNDYAPFVEIHYNAIDMTGETIKYAASSKITADISTNVYVTCDNVKPFGKDGSTIFASDISINDELAVSEISSEVIATISHSNNRLTFSLPGGSFASADFNVAFKALALVGNIIKRRLTGAVLLVEKTIPDVKTILSSGTQIIDIIHSDLNSTDKVTTLHAPGGIITFDSTSEFGLDSGDLIGDDEGGVEYENSGQDSIDTSQTPVNYFPLHSSDDGQINPVGVASANVNSSTHSSVFNQLTIGQSSSQGNRELGFDGVAIGDLPDFDYSTGVYVDAHCGHIEAGSTTVAVYGESAVTHFAVGGKAYSSEGVELGTISALTHELITFSSGILAELESKEEVHNQPHWRAPPPSTGGRGGVHGGFDILDSVSIGNNFKIFIQPSDKTKHSQLSKLRVGDSFNVHYLMSKGRVLSFGSDNNNNITMVCHGVNSDIAGTSIDLESSGSPDSHIVKEIMPGAPVVTVTLGGPGQGALNTKDTWDPSALSRLGWNTRRDNSTKAVSHTTGSPSSITVNPLNNNSDALASWGAYGFPTVGKLYFPIRDTNRLTSSDISITEAPPKFASVSYTARTGNVFTLVAGTGHLGKRDYILSDGTDVDSFAAWVTATGFKSGAILQLDDKFNPDNICADGTTVNDRLFQSVSSVQHDYQLGTQYASTRAMVEIPLFEEFFFDDMERGIFPGPDNSMRLHVDATYTAHSWAPNPVGRRADDIVPQDPEVNSAYSYAINTSAHRSGTKIVKPYDVADRRVFLESAKVFPNPQNSAAAVAGIDDSIRPRRAYLPNGEWVLYESVDTSTHYLQVWGGTGGDDYATNVFSKNFLRDLEVGIMLTPAPGIQDSNYEPIADNPLLSSVGYEGRRPYYYDRANMMTQGGNIDYGMKQYVSAVEFRAGPATNPHLDRIQSGLAKTKVVSLAGTALVVEDASNFPLAGTTNTYEIRVAWVDEAGTAKYAYYAGRVGNAITLSNTGDWASAPPAVGTEIIAWDFYSRTALSSNAEPISLNEPWDNGHLGIVNLAWANPYAPGGLRHGDTVWMNMHYTNPHAIEGYFCKSRGVLNENIVHTQFNGGRGATNSNPRDSIPLENFLIGDTCTETAKNFVQHINKSIELHKLCIASDVQNSSVYRDKPMVAYVDPYQCTEEFTRVLLYDVAHDREFIAFQDIWMQVQSSPDAVKIGKTTGPNVGGLFANTSDEANAAVGLIDVPPGYASQNKHFTSASQRSEFIESAYVHAFDKSNRGTAFPLGNVNHGHNPDIGSNGISPRTNDAVIDGTYAYEKHLQVNASNSSYREQSTFFDTPDGTRVIPAFLALKGIRNSKLSLTNHKESRLQHLTHWTDMDFVRRLSVDLGEVGVKEGVTDIEAAAKEVVRLINQAGAKNGQSHARRPADQYLGESERFDLTSVGVKGDSTNRLKDPTAPHQNADFSASGSTHDPASFWDENSAFSSHDRGTHMGYVRAHLGRVVLDTNGNKGYSIIIHSTIPGASGRNFCTWLDNSKSQTPYQPQFLIGHGGRMRNYWCQPGEIAGENMHPAPMPINRHGRPFAPITTLKEMLPPEEVEEGFRNNMDMGSDYNGTSTLLVTQGPELATGRVSNTMLAESFESKNPDAVLVNGLRVGTQAKARINFGGMTQAGIPGWGPDCSDWGFPADASSARFNSVYGEVAGVTNALITTTTVAPHIPNDDLKPVNIGNNPFYGIRFVDHRGKSHTVRFVYREYGQKVGDGNKILPPTIDDEIIIWFDDRDVGQGGFTIGRHMVGKGDACGRVTAGAEKLRKGNRWQTYPSPAVGISAAVTYDSTNNNLELVLADPYDTGGELSSADVLGYLGFPEKGVIELNTASGNTGIIVSYSSRSNYDKDGGGSNKHFLYDITHRAGTISDATYLVSPRVNWTSLLTDEVISAAVEYAIKMQDPNSEDISETSFDCRDMYAADGKTLGEWGIGKNAIRIKAHAKGVMPLRHLFEVSRNKDWGLQGGASEASAIGSNHLGGLSTTEIDDGKRLDVGYIPETVLHITTKYRGANANTATPVLVNSQNNVVSTELWQQNLRGEKYRKFAGDHIIPCINNYMTMVDYDDMTAALLTVTAENFFLFITPGSTNIAASWGERVTAWINDEDYTIVESKTDASGDNYAALNLQITATDNSTNFEATRAALDGDSLNNLVFSRYGAVKNSIQVDGIRRAGSTRSSPFLYFRGARDSPDHWVPLFFGGGFSGVVMDINDGSNNDYSDFYTHPYSSGPTGCSGLQNIGENSGSYALLDANAILAMFPGTAYLDQHKGDVAPPFFNQDALLSFDLNAGASASTAHTGLTYGTDASDADRVKVTRPSPVVIRFAHPHARYNQGVGTKDYDVDEQNQTTYMIFGPGQSIPHNTAATEPLPSTRIVTATNLYSVPVHTSQGSSRETFLPNPIHNGGDAMSGTKAYLPNSFTYQINNLEGWNYVMNWEPAQGSPNMISGVHSSNAVGYKHDAAASGRFLSDYVVSGNNTPYAHPFTSNGVQNAAGTAFGASGLSTTRLASMCWYMDGGYHPGGNFLDNHILRNPNHPVSGIKAMNNSGEGSNEANYNATSFRVAAQLASAYGATAATALFSDYMIVDATRCQNAEELATVIATAINTYPGSDPLKAIGGTFLPSFQTGHNQDKYGWYKLSACAYVAHSGSTAGYITMAAAGAKPIPEYGWLRIVKKDGGGVFYAPYITYNSGTGVFTLAKHAMMADTDPRKPYDNSQMAAFSNDAAHEVYVWSKTGTHQYNNRGSDSTTRLHMTQVHFSGLVDAVDRTKPVGAVGWHGEAYSYLNSYSNDVLQNPAGKGAWHSFLGFSPYGPADNCFGASLPMSTGEASAALLNDFCSMNLSSRHLIAITHESELPLIAKADRDGVLCTGDWICVRAAVPTGLTDASGEGHALYPNNPQFSHPVSTSTYNHLASAGTTLVNTTKVFNKSRYIGPATGGPNIEALIHTTQTLPHNNATYPNTANEAYWHANSTNATLELATPCQSPTGDLFWDTDIVPGMRKHELDSATIRKTCISAFSPAQADSPEVSGPYYGLHGFYKHRSAAQNFNVEHIVWKRMDGGSLSMPSANSRGLGMVPRTVRTASSGALSHIEHETIYGNCRFSFETTNSAMFPIIQAQEISHPQVAQQHPFEVRNALSIPNEDLQFSEIVVKDDTGQTHTIAGGSPFGTVIYDFRHVSDREIDGLAPSIAGSGLTPNMKIRLPNPDDIPGNIIIRSGFDRIQADQSETWGSGGMNFNWNSITDTSNTNFTKITSPFSGYMKGPRAYPNWENLGWEHISQTITDGKPINDFPFSNIDNFGSHTNNYAPLLTTYEPHDRALYFHVTKMGHSSTKRESKGNLTYGTGLSGTNFVAATGPTLTTAEANAIWNDTAENSGGRRFFRIEDSTTGKSILCSYTSYTHSTFTFAGIVTAPNYDDFITSATTTNLKIYPSYYVPAGTTRFFASRRLRDHSEFSGNSPDMPNIDWENIGATSVKTQLTTQKLTPMPIPRMGHNYVTPTMAIMPGHYAHPAYQRMFDLHQSCKIAESQSTEYLEADITSPTDSGHNLSYLSPLIWFSTPTAAHSPSDIHGSAFTLLTESKIKYEGYGIAASIGDAGAINAQGGHSIVLEAAGAYTLNQHFPDPMETGAYQIIIQPNLVFGQIEGFHNNANSATLAPSQTATYTPSLTTQQVNTVIALEHDVDNLYGAYTLVLAEATMADIRGCEIIINEVMLDMEPDAGSQFTNIPTLGLYNALGVNENTSPPFTRRSLPYHPNMFQKATPGYTLTVPWWSVVHSEGVNSVASSRWRNLEWLKPDNYYEVSRNTFGAIGGQITLAGYPSSYLDIYEGHYRNRSLTPVCTVYEHASNAVRTDNVYLTVATNHSAGTAATFGGNPKIIKLENSADMNKISVGMTVTGTGIASSSYVTQIDSDTLFRVNNNTTATNALIEMTVAYYKIVVNNADLFPVRPGYGEYLEYTDSDGKRRLATYLYREGAINTSNSPLDVLAGADYFIGVVGWENGVPSTNFASVLDTIISQSGPNPVYLKLSGPYNNRAAGEIYTNSDKSIATRTLPQLLHGTRDTNSLHSPDAFLCAWHPNLGRPFTWYSDNSSRGFYDKNGAADTPVDKVGYNHIPEHFETIHYHDFFYAASKGPFNLSMTAPAPPSTAANGTAINNTGASATAAAINAVVDGSVTLNPQGGNYQSVGRVKCISIDDADYDAKIVTVTSTDGTIRAYTFDDDAAPNDTAVVGSGTERIVRIQGDTTTRAIAMRLKMAIEHSDGHNGKILVEITDDDNTLNSDITPHTLLLTQATVGSAGNVTIASTAATTTLTVAGFNDGGQYNYIGFWPGGSRGGPAVSRLDGFADAMIGWGPLTDLDCFGYKDSSVTSTSTEGISKLTYNKINSLSDYERNRCFGYRFGLRQPYNRPRWSIYTRAFLEIAPYIIEIKTATLSNINGEYIILKSTIDDRIRKYVFDSSGSYTSGQYKDANESIPEIYVNTNGESTVGGIRLELQTAITNVNGHGSTVSVRNNPYVNSSTAGWLILDNVAWAHSDADVTHIAQYSVSDTASQIMQDNVMLTNNSSGYHNGPLVQSEAYTSAYLGSGSGFDTIVSTEYSSNALLSVQQGILERLTQITALLNEDQLNRQVRYSDGRRITRSFGCPVRTIRNSSSVRRLYPGDDVGKGIDELATAHRYYMVDWWGNTRGEDVRRFPARGFGIRPAWDPEDAYLDVNIGDRITTDVFKGDLTDRLSGEDNTTNNDIANMSRVDWFNPQTALRVGDRGDGRGVRWPTVFNESMLHDISNSISSTGMVLSANTAEPNFGKGLIRASNSPPTGTEVKRGISNRLGITDDYGLLKPEASVSKRTDTLTGTFTYAVDLFEPVSRSAPRIGIDADNLGDLRSGQKREYVAIGTQAYSLQTDREVGQRTALGGSYTGGNRILLNLDMRAMSWSNQPTNAVIKSSNCYAMWPLGGSYILEVSNYAEPFDDSGWGNLTATTPSGNPYQDSNHSPSTRTNITDKSVAFMVRPSRVIDNTHNQMFRHAPAVKTAAPQSQSKARATITFSGATTVDQTITIIDTNGLSKTYTAKGSTTAGSLQFINTDAVAAAAALKTCIENAAGHPSTITVGLHSDGTGIGKNRLTLTQVAIGTVGNTTITENLANVTVTNFLYGSDNGNNFYRATSGGKYGMFNFYAASARTARVYSPVYALAPSTSLTVPVAHGPLITGAMTSAFLSTKTETDAKATSTITITDYSQLNNGDVVSLISTGATTHNFTIGAQNPGSKTWALVFTNTTGAYNNDPTITVDSTLLLQIGMNVSGTGIPTGATVSSITNATTFELSADTTGGSLSSQTLTFTSNEIAADNLAACITHQSDFIAESIGDTVHVTQTTVGSAGNTAITLTDSSAAATATITVADGDALVTAGTTLAEKQKMTLVSTDGTSKTYVIVDDHLTTVATGDILVSASDTGAGTAGDSLAHGIAVAVNISSSAVTQNVLLVGIKAAIEHANGHAGKITVSSVPGAADGAQVITLTQAVLGIDGNTTITQTMGNVTDADFSGGHTTGMSKSNFVGGVVYTPKTDGLSESIGRIVMSDNTLRHFRSDAPRRVTEVETDKQDRPDYSVNARYSQSTYPKALKRF